MIFWYLSRAAGFTAFLLLFLNVFLGLAVRTRFLDRLFQRWRVFDLHQFTALLALGFLGLHVLSLLGDTYIGFRLSQLFVPLTSPYRPTWVAVGTVSLYLIVLIIGSFHVRKVIGHRGWRGIHYLSFVTFLLVLVHGLLSGSDGSQAWARAIYASTGAVIASLVIWRFSSTRGKRRGKAVVLPRRSVNARRPGGGPFEQADNS